MARLRKFVAYRGLDRPYTRKSKYRKHAYVKANPNCKVVKFGVGNKSKKFQFQVDLSSKEALQIRDNALESARLTVNRALEKNLGKPNYHLKVRTYPHHILREHALASGAGADRFSSGMARSFGKPTGVAAQIDKGQKIMTVYVDKPYLEQARRMMARAKHKLPCKTLVTVKEVEF